MDRSSRVFARFLSLVASVFLIPASVAMANGLNFETHIIHSGDMNGDGQLDWVLQPRTSQHLPSIIFSADESGQTREAHEVDDPTEAAFWVGAQVAIGDVDANGMDDVVLWSGSQFRVYRSRITSNAANRYRLKLKQDESYSTLGLTGTFADSTLMLADFNGDGREDWVLNPTDAVRDLEIVFSKNQGIFESAKRYTIRVRMHAGDLLLFEDFNGDLITDVLAHRVSRSNLRFFMSEKGTHEGSALSDQGLGIVVDRSNAIISATDWDSDGLGDLLVEEQIASTDPSRAFDVHHRALRNRGRTNNNGAPKFAECAQAGIQYGNGNRGLAACVPEIDAGEETAIAKSNPACPAGGCPYQIDLSPNPCEVGYQSPNSTSSSQGCAADVSFAAETRSAPCMFADDTLLACTSSMSFLQNNVAAVGINYQIRSSSSPTSMLHAQAMLAHPSNGSLPAPPASFRFDGVSFGSFDPVRTDKDSVTVCWRNHNAPQALDVRVEHVNTSDQAHILSTSTTTIGGVYCHTDHPRDSQLFDDGAFTVSYRVQFCWDGTNDCSVATSDPIYFYPVSDAIEGLDVSGVERPTYTPVMDSDGNFALHWQTPTYPHSEFLAQVGDLDDQRVTGNSHPVSIPREPLRVHVPIAVTACVSGTQCLGSSTAYTSIQLEENAPPGIVDSIVLVGVNDETPPQSFDGTVTANWSVPTGQVGWYKWQLQEQVTGQWLNIDQRNGVQDTTVTFNDLVTTQDRSMRVRVRAHNLAGHTGWKEVDFDVLSPPASTDNPIHLQTLEDQPLAIDFSQWISDANTAPEDMSITIVADPNPAHGTLAQSGPMEFAFTPVLDFHNQPGDTFFTIMAEDANGLVSDEIVVDVEVTPMNDAPVAQAQSASVQEDTPLTIFLNATDVDGDSITYGIDSSDNGTVSQDQNAAENEFVFSPHPDFNSDTGLAGAVHFFATDGSLNSEIVTYSVMVTGVNDRPLVSDQTVTVDQGESVSIDLTGYDVDGDPLTYVVGDTAAGTLSGTAPHLVYTPSATYVAEDSFTFSASDGVESSTVSTVSIGVVQNEPPVFTQDGSDRFNRVGDETTVTYQAIDPEGGTITYAAMGLPSGLTLDTDGSITGSISASAGSYAVEIEAKDDFDLTTTLNFVWVIGKPLGDGLQRVSFAAYNMVGGNPNTFSLFLEYPVSHFDTETGEPTHFQVKSAFGDALVELIPVQPGQWQPSWTSETIDNDDYLGSSYLIAACRVSLCGPDVRVDIGDIEVDTGLPAVQLAMTPPANAQFDLQMTVADHPDVDYFEITEVGVHGNRKLFSEPDEIRLSRTFDSGGSDYTYKVRACERNRQDGDRCGPSSNAVAYVSDQQPDPAVMTSVENLGHVDQTDPVVLRWTYNRPDFMSSASSPDYFQIVYEPEFGLSQVYEVVAHNYLSVWEYTAEPDDPEDPDAVYFGAGRYAVSACQRAGGCSSSVVYELLDLSAPGYASTPPTQANTSGGPQALAPGEWWDSTRHGTGWSFYWANDLHHSSTDALYGNTYDLFAYWMTYMKIEGIWRPTWLFARLKHVEDCAVPDPQTAMPNPDNNRTGCFTGALTQGLPGVSEDELSVGSVAIHFGSDAFHTRIIGDVSMLGLQGGFDFELEYFGVEVVDNPGTNPNDYLSGVYWDDSAPDPEYNVLNWLDDGHESMLVLWYDDQQRPIWVRGDEPRSTGPAEVYFALKHVKKGFDPMAETPDYFDTSDAEFYGSAGDATRIFDTENLGVNHVEVDLDITQLPVSEQLETRRAELEMAAPLQKHANLHDIRAFVDDQDESNPTCESTNGEVCPVRVTWFTDGHYDDIRAYRCAANTSVEDCMPVGGLTSIWPAAEDVVHDMSETGEFVFELRRSSAADAPVIARSTPNMEIEIVDPPQVSSIIPSLPTNNDNYFHSRPDHQPQVLPTSGSGGVSGGAATFAVPIAVPPGRRGMQPSVALSYSSRAGNGPLGMGWSLSAGLSSIHRCAQTVAQDGQSRSVDFSLNDRLCLDGQRLIQVSSGTYGLNGSEYRTEIDSFQRVRITAGSMQGSAATFEVNTRNNRTYVYDVAVTPDGGTAPVSWKISSMRDASGNMIQYEYTDYGSGEVLIDEIVYTGKYANGSFTPGNRVVEFDYTSRPANDRDYSYLAGTVSAQTQILDDITTRVGAEKVRTYVLTYGESAATRRPVLTGVTEGAYDGISVVMREPLMFHWADDGISDPESVEYDLLLVSGAGVPEPEVVPPVPVPYYHDPADPQNPAAPSNPDPQPGDPMYMDQPAFVGMELANDYDGDGEREVRFVVRGTGAPRQLIGKLNEDGTISEEAIDAGLFRNSGFLGAPTPGADFDKDGRTDLVGYKDGSIRTYHWKGTGDFSLINFDEVDTGIPFTGAISLLADGSRIFPSYDYADVNNDGEVDFLVVSNINNEAYLHLWVKANGSDIQCGNQSYCIVGQSGLSGSPSVQNALYQMATNDVPAGVAEGGPGGFSPLRERVSHLADIDGNGLLDIFISQPLFDGNTFGLNKVLHFTNLTSTVAQTGTREFKDLIGIPGINGDQSPFDMYHLLADVNGDGLSDYVYVPATLDVNDRKWHIRLNTGKPITQSSKLFGPAINTDSDIGIWPLLDNGASGSAEYRAKRWRPRYAQGIRVVDFDSDGKQELLFPADIAARFCLGIHDSEFAPEGEADIFCAPTVGTDDAENGPNLYDVPGMRGWDDSIYRFDVLRFDQTSPTQITASVATELPGNGGLILGSLQGIQAGDLFGDGYTDLFGGVGRRTAWGHHRIEQFAAEMLANGIIQNPATATRIPNQPDNAQRIERKTIINRGRTLNRVHPVDTLVDAMDGDDNQWEWTHAPLSDADVYSVPQAQADRYIDDEHFYFTSSMYVVSAFDEPNGALMGTNRTMYDYSEAVFNNEGRGFQGFRRIASTQAIDDGNDLTSVSVFHQKFPLAGRLESTYTVLADEPIGTGGSIPAHAINSTDNVWECMNSAPVAVSCDSQPSSVNANVYQPVLSAAFTATSALPSIGSGSATVRRPVNETGQWFEYDEYGNVLEQETVQRDLGEVNNTSVTYHDYRPADTVSWWIRRRYLTRVYRQAWYEGEQQVPSGVNFDQTAEVTTLTLWDDTSRQPDCTLQVTGNQTASLQSATHCDTSGMPTPWLTSEFGYDEYGNPDSVTVGANDESSRTTATTYDSSGYFPDTVTQEFGHQTQTEFDPRYGQPTRITNPNGQINRVEYDLFGMELDRYYPINETAGLTNRGNHYAPRSSARITGAGADCPQMASYGAIRCLVSITDGAPKVSAYLDRLGRTVATRTSRWNENNLGAYTITRTTYNPRGQNTGSQVPAVPNATKYWSELEYDPLGRVIKKSSPTQESAVDESLYLYTHYLHDGLTTKVWVGESADLPSGACDSGPPILDDRLCVTRTYASNGQLLRTVDALGGRTRFWADAQGNPALIEDPNGNQTVAFYNEFGQRTKLFDPNMGNSTYTYNGFGEVLTQTDARGAVINYQYDTLGRMTQRDAVSHDEDVPAISDRWTFDVDSARIQPLLPASTKGHLLAESRTVGGIPRFRREYGLDARHRPTGHFTQMWPQNENLTELALTVDNDEYLGRPIRTTYPRLSNDTSAVVVYHKYDKNGYLIEEGESADYDSSNPQGLNPDCAGICDRDYLRQVSRYSPAGSPEIVRYGNGTETNNAYYRANWQLKSTKVDGVMEWQYQYDRFGNLANQTNEAAKHTETFTYDRLHRLTNASLNRATGTDEQIAYGYDKLGNITSKSDYAVDYVYENRPNAVTQVTRPDGTVEFDYDANGNMISEARVNSIDPLATYVYDAFNKPTSMYRLNAGLVKFEEGSNLQRYFQRSNQGSKFYIDKVYEVEEGKEKIYLGDYAVWSIGGTKDGIKYLHRDRLGSVTAITTNTGNIVGSANRGHDPFGGPRGEIGEAKSELERGDITDRGYTDHEHLDGMQLIHMNGRAFDYQLGRFLSVDPFIQFPENSQSLNPYTYVLNNPLSGTDPSGYLIKGNSSGGWRQANSLCITGMGCIGVGGGGNPSDNGKSKKVAPSQSQGIASIGSHQFALNAVPEIIPLPSIPPTIAPPISEPSRPTPLGRARLAKGLGATLGRTLGFGITLLVVPTNGVSEDGCTYGGWHAGCGPLTGYNFGADGRYENPAEEMRGPTVVYNEDGDLTYYPPPKVPPAFPDVERARPKTPIQGGGGLRKRWKDRKGKIYEWDSAHGKIEKFNKRGKHLGEFDPNTGEQTKPADPSREVEP